MFPGHNPPRGYPYRMSIVRLSGYLAYQKPAALNHPVTNSPYPNKVAGFVSWTCLSYPIDYAGRPPLQTELEKGAHLVFVISS